MKITLNFRSQLLRREIIGPAFLDFSEQFSRWIRRSHGGHSMIKIVRLQLRRQELVFLLVTLMPLLLLSMTTAFAGSATWELNPGSGDWNTDANWTPATGYPNGSADT